MLGLPLVVGGRRAWSTVQELGSSEEFVSRGMLIRARAERYEVKVHEVLAMSNHLHFLVTDVEGTLPDFMRDLDSLLARPRATLAALLIGCRSYKGPRSSENTQSVNLRNAQVQGGTDDADLELREGLSNGTLTSS